MKKSESDMEMRERIDKFIEVASQRHDDEPEVWDGLYESLLELVEGDDETYLETQYARIQNKAALEEWDEDFLETTIDSSKTKERLARPSAEEALKQQLMEEYLKMQQQAYRIAQNSQPGYPYMLTTTDTTAPSKGLLRKLLG
jgi:hypothetical protein